MKNKITLITLILFLVISLSTYASASFEITPDIDTLVPEDALMYFHISNPEKLLESADNFLAATGMNEFTGYMPLQDFIGMLLTSKEDLSLEYLNLSKPAGFALLPSTSEYAEKDDMDFILFVPINTSMNILDLIRNKPEENDFWYTIFMNYLVYFSSEDLMEDFPSNTICDLSQMDTYSDDSLSIYLDIEGLMESFGFDASDIINEIKNQDTSGSDLVTGIIEGYLYLFSQMEVLFSNIALDREGIIFQSDLFFADKMENIIKSFQPADGIKEWSSYLPEKGFIQGIYSMNPEDRKMITGNVLEYLFASSENNAVMSELKRNMVMFSDYIGTGGAFSIDFPPSYAQAGGIKKNNPPQKYIDDVSLPFEIKLNMVTDLTDSEGFLHEFRKFYSDQSLNSFMDSLYADLDFSFHITMEELNINEISPVFRMTYELQDRKIKSGNNFGEMEPVKNFLNNMEFWYHISDDKMYSYIGPQGLEGLKALTDENASEKDWVRSAPDNANLIWEFSLSELMKHIGKMPGLEELAPFSMIRFGSTGYSNFNDGSIHSSANLSSESIRSLFQMIMEPGL